MDEDRDESTRMAEAQVDLQRIVGDRFLVIDVAGVLWMHLFLDVKQIEIDGKTDFIIVLKEEYVQKAKEWKDGQKLGNNLLLLRESYPLLVTLQLQIQLLTAWPVEIPHIFNP